MHILVPPALGCPDSAATIIIAGLCAIHTKGEALGVCILIQLQKAQLTYKTLK